MEWINFNEVKPLDGERVLSITSDGVMEVMYFNKDWQHCLCQYNENVKVFNITHWMPLPEPPKN